jgi:hypothetical protein
MVTNSSRTRLGALITIMVVLATIFASAPASAAPAPGSKIAERGKIALYVYDAGSMSKVPIYKAHVRLHDQSSDSVLSGYTDAKGSFGGVVKSGSYFVTVQANAFKDVTFEVVIKPAYTTTTEAGLDKTEPPLPMGIG